MAEKKIKVVPIKLEKESKKEEDTPEKKKIGTYHLAKRASDGKWQVKMAGAEKAVKLFNTKAEAEVYVKELAKRQDRSVVVHPSKGKNKGKIQKL